jgi:hypothetical protein
MRFGRKPRRRRKEKQKAEGSRLAGTCWRVGRAQRSAETREPRAALPRLLMHHEACMFSIFNELSEITVGIIT